jgi:hypothetical protein
MTTLLREENYCQAEQCQAELVEALSRLDRSSYFDRLSMTTLLRLENYCQTGQCQAELVEALSKYDIDYEREELK